MTAPSHTAATIARMKREILVDIEDGLVPTTVRSFSELHDHVDANEYGGLCSDAPASMTDAETAQNAVNEWLSAGRPDAVTDDKAGR